MQRQVAKPKGRKWHDEDWIKIQDELYRALEQGTLGDMPDCILSGVEVSNLDGDKGDLSAGIVFIDGKICDFPKYAQPGLCGIYKAAQ